MPDPDALARLAYEAFYAALGVPHQPWGWAHLRPQVQAAWRVVVQVVQEGDAAAEDTRGGSEPDVPAWPRDRQGL